MSAEMFYEDLKNSYENDVQSLQADEQLVPFYYAAGGEAITVDNMGYSGSDLIWFHGEDLEKQLCTVLVHVASASLVLKVVKTQEAKERRTIGFTGQRDSKN